MYFVFCFHFKIWCIYVFFVHVQRESMFNASVLLLANDCWVFIFPCYSVRDRLSYSVCADVLTASGLCGLVLKLFGTELILHFIVGLSSTGLFVCQGWIERDCKQWVCSVSDFNIASLSLLVDCERLFRTPQLCMCTNGLGPNVKVRVHSWLCYGFIPNFHRPTGQRPFKLWISGVFPF